jgi:hypothetical protein
MRPFTPFRPTGQPPPGWYDPALDAQERAAGRGLQDFSQDTQRDQERAEADYTLGRGNIAWQHAQQFNDILRSRARLQQDTGIAQAGINRQYALQANRQLQQGAAAGLLGGGFLRAAARKRAANKALDDAQLRLSHSRGMEDSRQGQFRLGRNTNLAYAGLGLQHSRGTQDRTTALARARRENTFFGQDVGAQRAYEAAGAGYIPPTRPRNERSRGGVTWREMRGGRNRLPGGRVVGDRALSRIIRQRRRRARRGSA